MTRIRFLSIGKCKNPELKTLLDYYVKLCGQFAKTELTVLSDKNDVLEGWLEKNGARAHLTILDENGKSFTSAQFSSQIEKIRDGSYTEWIIVCAGAFGFSAQTKAKAKLLWSLSPMIMPHELAFVVAAEQVFRGLSILHKHPYHHE